ncbi:MULTISPECIES: STAS domain-containing protein [unclassified Krasilnikovia]|uniref:STAS domain-containing protein n=1 Tax=unclassified Krasilnikovia TaxID=2622557 RepID=UPI00399D45B6
MTDTCTEPGQIMVMVRGEIDMAVCDDLAGVLRDAIGRTPDGQAVVVDLSQTSFLDCAGIRTLLDSRRAATTAGDGFRVIGASGLVARVLGATGVLATLTHRCGE